MLEPALLTAAVVLLLAGNTAGVLLNLLSLPGNWLTVVVCGGFAWYRWGAEAFSFGPPALGLVLGFALLGELLEFLTGALGSAAAGGSRRGAVLSVPGAVAGAVAGSLLIPVPVVGTLLGAAAGGGFGALAGDRWAGRGWRPSLKAAGGAAVGKVTGTLLKMLAGVAQWVTAAVALWW